MNKAVKVKNKLSVTYQYKYNRKEKKLYLQPSMLYFTLLLYFFKH